MMRGSRFAVVPAVSMLVLALVMSGSGAFVVAQDSPIVPIGEDAASGDGLRFDGQWYVRDRNVPVNTEPLQETADDDGNPIFLKPGESDPLGAVYVLLDTEGMATRYLPQYVGSADAACPADMVEAGTVQGDAGTYVAVAPEPDATADMLTYLTDTDQGQAVYTWPNDDSMEEILVGEAPGEGNVPLVRYVLVGPDGVPASMTEGFTFGGAEYLPQPGALTSLDGLVWIGCSGLFPVYAEGGAPYATIALDVNGTVVSFAAVDEGAGAAEAPPASPPATPPSTLEATPPHSTPEATPPPSTAEATPPPATVAPPTEAPPTETPAPTATLEPTAVPPTETPQPTEVPATEIPAPTEEPEEPAPPVDEPEATEAPTEAPEPPATEAPPTATVPPEAEDEEALPTEAPPTPAPGTPEPTAPPTRPTPTPRVFQPRAVVPTLPADAPPPPASQSTGLQCVGNVGPVDDNGVPEQMPRAIQFQGSGYRYSGQVNRDEVGALSGVACAGAFTIYTVEDDSGIYLGASGSSDGLFRFEPTSSFTVRSQVDNQPRTIMRAAEGDQPEVVYRAGEPLVRSIYTALSAELYVADAEDPAPDRVLAYVVTGELIGEYRPEGSAEIASPESLERAEAVGLNARMVLGGQPYVLQSTWTPYGTTTNGWVMLYGRDGEETPEQLAGIDPRREDLQLYNRDE